MSRPYFAPKQVYTGNGSLDAYTFDFKITAKTQLLVVVVDADDLEVQRVRGDDVVFLTDVTFDSTLGGGEVTLAANLTSGHRMALLLADDQPAQAFEFSNKTSFSLKRIENALDVVVGAVQRLAFRARQAFRIHDLDDETTFDAQLPPGIADAANYNRTFAINDDGTGFVFGPTTDTIAGAVGAAATAVAAAADAVEAAVGAAESEDIAFFWGNLFLFENFVNVDDTDNPVALTVAEAGILYLADDTSADVDFTLPPLASVTSAFKVGIIKKSSALNAINVTPDGSETILSFPTFALTERGIGVVFYKDPDLATNWAAKFFAFAESQAAGSLPSGGAAGAALVKASATNGDVEWDDLAYEGYSSRFSATVSLAGLKDVLDYIMAITYLGPLIASFSGSSNSLREKGTSVSGITLTVNVTKRSNLIAQIVFKQSGTAFETLAPPVQTGSGATASSIAVTPFSDNMTFSVEVTDAVVGPDGGNTVTSSTTYSFVYPYYYGADVPGLTPSQVAALTKVVTSENTNYNRSFTTANGDVYYFAYPAAYGNLTSILDENGFETFSSWTKTTANITGLDTTAVSYNIYESNNPVVAGSTNFTFIQ